MKKLTACATSICITLATPLAFAHNKWSTCGSGDHLRKICQAVPEMKKVKEIKWECKCEEICIPGRTQTHDCQPDCGRVRAVRKLVKKEVTKEVPGFKWVATYTCDSCSDTLEVQSPAKEKP